MPKPLKTFLAATFDPMVVITVMTTVTLIVTVLAVASSAPSKKVVALCLCIALVGLITIVIQIWRIINAKNIREQLGRFLKEGMALQVRCADERIPPPAKDVQDWINKVDAYVTKKLSEADAIRLHNDSGLPMVKTYITSNAHYVLWYGTYRRVARLSEILAER